MSPARPLDPRRHAIRDDLADIRLRDRVERPRYAAATRRVIAVPSARCYAAPALGAFDTEFLFGEPVDVFAGAPGEPDPLAASGRWSWVQSAVDGYVGYVESGALAAAVPAPTHVVCVPSATVYASPSIKHGLTGTLPLGARVEVTQMVEAKERYAQLAGLDAAFAALRGTDGSGGGGGIGFSPVQHLRALTERPADWVALAEQFVGTPYVWGGKSAQGIDCSGLVQLVLEASDLRAPRDSDMQAGELGDLLGEQERLRRGDLIFWKGHVGIMLSAETLLHANGFHMLTVAEPLATASARLAAMGLEITAKKRL